MDDYQLELQPFYVNPDTEVSLFKGTSRSRNNLPIVSKRHEFHFIQTPQTQKSICQSLNAALAQAKVQHPNVCDVLEVQLEISGTNCTVYHILESLEGSAWQDITAGKRSTEVEMRNVLYQTSSALACAHSKVRNR